MIITCEYKNVSKSYTSGMFGKNRAVDDFSLSVASGEIFGIVGPNGAGKSSILKMLLGFIRPDGGSITVFGNSPSDPESRARLGYLPENPYFYDHLSAEELLEFSASASGMPKSRVKARMDYLLNLVGLEKSKKKKLRSYSKGMTQRAGICFALVHDPDLVILDEPMSGLDPLGRKMVVDLILDLKKNGKTVLFCSHILSDVERICDRVAIMVSGRLKRVMEKKELVESEKMIRIYVDGETDQLKQECGKRNCRVSEGSENGFFIECTQESVPELLIVCEKFDCRIINIDYGINTMERIFMDTVRGDDK